MSGKFLTRVSALSLALLLVACGGDDSSTPLAGSGNNNNGNQGEDTTTDTGTNTAEVGTIKLVASPIRLNTSANAQSAITARVKDANGILLEGIPVNFSANNGGTLEITQSKTDQAGVASAVLTSDGDPRNRAITITAQADSISDSVNVEFSGTSLAISGSSSISLGNSASLRVTLADADGNGIPNETVNLSTTLGTLAATMLTTSPNGVVDVQLNSGAIGGDATVTASAFSGESEVSASRTVVIASDSFGFKTPAANTEVNLGAQQTVTIQWLVNGNPIANGTQIQYSATRGLLTPANGLVSTTGGKANISISSSHAGFSTITALDPNTGLSADLDIEFVATTPDKIVLQATKTQLDLGGKSEIIAIIRDGQNNLVKNQEVTFNILKDGSGGELISSRDITDSQGRASTIYQGGANSSGRYGVEIESTVSGSISDTVVLTVARQALRLAIGTGNEIQEPDTVRYIKDYVAIVTDANGAPVGNANIELSVLPTGFKKGFYTKGAESWIIEPANQNNCDAEDTNRNGQLDAGEDFNNNGKLEPTNSASTSSSSVISAADGSADFALTYPQSHCNWVKVELTATVRVDGSESVETSEFFLSCSAEDLNDLKVQPPGGIGSLYGTDLDCSSTN